MRLQNKPVELLYMRNGEHVLRKPLERLASQEMDVDWYDFWLNGHEDDPAQSRRVTPAGTSAQLQKANEASDGSGHNVKLSRKMHECPSRLVCFNPQCR